MDEADLEALGDRPECHCGGAPGVDACFSPLGCERYCERYARLIEACPQLAD